jgi:hypothetical protein
MTIRSVGSRAGVLLGGAVCVMMAAAPAAAQENGTIQSALKTAAETAATETASAVPEPQAAAPAAPPVKPNSGNIAATVNFDVLPGTAYVFRGITQELDPQMTFWPSADIGFTLHSADKGLKSVAINTGVWNSLQTGSTGLDGPSNKLHYEEDYYATLTLGGSKASFAITYTAYTSPNAGFGTTQEILFKVSPTYKYGPYVILAQEMAGGADAGPNVGTYLELGLAGPSFAAKNGKFSVTVPVKVGLSLHDYYEHPVTGEDHNFGYFDVGVLVSLPISKFATSYGTWNFHFGGDFLAFGDTTKYFNDGNSTKGVFLFGIGFTY